jgi:hypothetical protein
VGLTVAQERPAISVRQGDDGRLAYAADPAGNTVIDFSTAGYAGGGVAIPLMAAKITVAPEGRRDGKRIQAALDLVTVLPYGPDAFRGAALLAPRWFHIDGGLRLSACGAVLRGSGERENGTVPVATGQSPPRRSSSRAAESGMKPRGRDGRSRRPSSGARGE